jgi:hypothetical protein
MKIGIGHKIPILSFPQSKYVDFLWEMARIAFEAL